MENSKISPSIKLGVGWGWYLLVGLMSKFAMAMKLTNGVSIVLELILFVGVVIFYFERRKVVCVREQNISKVSQVSLRIGFYSMLLFLAGLFLVGILDELWSNT